MRNEDAAAGVVSFIIALALFMVAISAVLLFTRDTAQDRRDLDHAVDQEGASALAQLLVDSPGIGWAQGADSLTRLGMQAPNGSGLSADSLAAMKGGTFAATANGLLDYDEARASLGIVDDFHIRIYPPNLAASLGTANLSHVQTAYIGHWLGDPSGLLDPLDPASAAQVAADAVQAIIADQERAALTQLNVDYDDLVHLDYAGWSLDVDLAPLPPIPLVDHVASSLLQGDVYPDDKTYLNTVLPGRLAGYDLLVVGSQVDQSSLTSNVVKDGIRDWVLAGGMLVVLGSDGQNFQWLQPLFDVGTSSVNGGAYAPDINHPVLTQPNELAWSEYDNFELGWDIKSQGAGAHYDDFQHIIIEDGEDVLAISDEGAFGSGRIFLTTYRIGDIADELGLAEGTGFLQNMVLYQDRSHLYLEYGPTVPGDQAVSAAVRMSHLWDPDLGQVPVRVEVLYWRSA